MGTGLDGNPEPDGACGVPGLYPVLKKCLWFLKRIHVLKFFNKLSLVFSMNINSAVYHANKCYYSCRLYNAAGYYQINFRQGGLTLAATGRFSGFILSETRCASYFYQT